MDRRNCAQVIAEMMTHIPESEKSLLANLQWNYNDAVYKAPEETLQWHRTTETVQKHFKKPTEEWQFKVLSVFTTKTVEEIKRMVYET